MTAERLVLVYCLITSILITARDTRAATAGRQRQNNSQHDGRPYVCRSLRWLSVTKSDSARKPRRKCVTYLLLESESKSSRLTVNFAARTTFGIATCR